MGGILKNKYPSTSYLERIETSNLCATCEKCNGTGFRSVEGKCHECGGHGLCRISNCYKGYRIPYRYIQTNVNMIDGRFNRCVDEKQCARYFCSRYACPDCKGTGKCEKCNGTGKQIIKKYCTSCGGKGKRISKDRMESVYLELLSSYSE